jgi:ubiquinone/menaquinone biosynthesis C-methylase UbiE
MDPLVCDYHVNNPVFVRIKRKFNIARLGHDRFVKSVFISERIIELPFVVRALAAVPPGAAVLDIGCSESILPLQLAGLGYRVTGLDVRRYPFQVPGLKFFKSDATAMPFGDGEFDGVTCISMLEHVGLGHYSDPRHEDTSDTKVTGEAARVLRKGGLFILSVPFGRRAVSRLQRTYDEARLKEVLAGFNVEDKRYYVNARLPQALNDHWRECSLDEASGVSSPERTACVCLVRARKN